MIKEKASWSKPEGMPGLIGRKKVDWSVFVYGTHVPLEFHPEFAEANGGEVLGRGSRREVVLLVDGVAYDAILTNIDRQGVSIDTLQIRYDSNEDLKRHLVGRLPSLYQYFQEHRAQRGEGDQTRINAPDDLEVYMDFYATDEPFRYRVEIVPAAKEMQQFAGPVAESEAVPVHQVAVPSTFEEVWEELGRVIGGGLEVRTLARGAVNNVEWLTDGIKLSTSQGTEFLSKAEYFEPAWSALNVSGIVDEERLPPPARYRSSGIFAVFALLPYVDYTSYPKLTLFLTNHMFGNDEVARTFGVSNTGGIRYAGTADDPRLVVFITGDGRVARDSHPYHDRWKDGALYYTGEGLNGDQQMTRGNRALQINQEKGFPLFGFQRKGANQYAFLGRFRVADVKAEEQSDLEGRRRTVFVFEMRTAGKYCVAVPKNEGDRSEARRAAGPPISLSDSVDALIQTIRARGFVYEPWQVAAYVTALRTKPFVILAGVSGTGKSKLPMLVASATGGQAEVIPVRPDWTDSSEALGYCDLKGKFRPGLLLRLAREASSRPDVQFVCVMDEMNLARVEQYFAEILSRIEERSVIRGGGATKPLLNLDLLPEDSSWGRQGLPANLAIVGTVNMDESTHGFSRKVLDRAFTLELSEVDLSRWETSGTGERVEHWPSEAWLPRARRLLEVGGVGEKERSLIVKAIDVLNSVNRYLAPAQIQVGYRTRDEVALFVLHAQEALASFVTSDGAKVDPLDLALQMKILPRVAGGSGAIRTALLSLLGWAHNGTPLRTQEEAEELLKGWDAGGRPTWLVDSDYPRTAARLCLMWDRLLSEGYTSFWL